MRLPALLLLVIVTAAPPANGQLVPEGAAVEKVADGYRFTEGPVLVDGRILFTDIPASLIVMYDPENGETKTLFNGTNGANGLAFHDGVLYGCAQGVRGIVKYAAVDVVQEIVTDKLFEADADNQVKQIRFNSPNDLAIDRDGGIYFTDPRYGNRDNMETEVEGVYYYAESSARGEDGHLAMDAQFAAIDLQLERPNGIVLSPDEKTLYVADNAANWIYAYDVVEPGKVENKRQFARLNNGQGGGSDGMCVDAQGRLYATGHNRVWVFEPTGELVASINAGPQTTNCTFGGDGRTLYITANKGLYRIKLNTDAPLEHAKATAE